MAFTEPQLRKLKAKLNDKYVRTRTNNGQGWSYIEGWHAIAEANRIFGHDGWDRRTLDVSCLATEVKGEAYHAAYRAKVRVTVRAGDTLIVRDGSGTGEAKATTPGQAHEVALKGAETDATKRALATFGNPFGLALYDRDHGVLRKNACAADQGKGPWTLRSMSGAFLKKYETAEEFGASLRAAMTQAPNIEQLFAIWEQNVTTVRTINRSLGARDPNFAKSLVSHLKACASACVKVPPVAADESAGATDKPEVPDDRRTRIDKSLLTFGEEKRYRSKEHLRFVASQPCLICGRAPSQAHHVRFAQSKGVGIKVSDEFTVPLCAIHHTENHATGDERSWWADRKVNPLDVATNLWAQSRHARRCARQPAATDAQSEESSRG